MKKEDQKKTKRPLRLDWDIMLPKNENGPPAEVVVVGVHFDDDKKQREADLSELTDHQLEEKIKRLEMHSSVLLKLPDKGEKLRMSLKLYKDELERRNSIRLRKNLEREREMEKEEDQKKTKRPLRLDWDIILPKNENGPPAEVVVVGVHFDDDKKQREADLSELTDHQLEEKIQRLEMHSSVLLKLPDKDEKLRMSLKLHKDELERRNWIRLRKEAECEKSCQSRSSGLPGACNSYGSDSPSQAHSKSKFVSRFGEHLDDKPDLSSRISVNPVSKKLSLVDPDNHRNASSKGLLMNNGGREIKAMKISPQCRGISGRDEHRSSIGAQNTIDSLRFYHSHSDGNSSVRSSKRRKASPVQASKQPHMKEVDFPLSMVLKYYVVWVGRQPGIYTSWEMGKRQTNGYPGNLYRSFLTREAASRAFNEYFGIMDPDASTSVIEPNFDIHPLQTSNFTEVHALPPNRYVPGNPLQASNVPEAQALPLTRHVPCNPLQTSNYTEVQALPPTMHVPGNPLQTSNVPEVQALPPTMHVPDSPLVDQAKPLKGGCLVFLQHLALVLLCLVLLKHLVS